jgi:hypothetical protein
MYKKSSKSGQLTTKKSPPEIPKAADGRVPIFMNNGRVSLKPENEKFNQDHPQESNSDISGDLAPPHTLGG